MARSVSTSDKVALVGAACQNGPLAQLVEQRPFKAWVPGSNPGGLRLGVLVYWCTKESLATAELPSDVGSNPTNSIRRKNNA